MCQTGKASPLVLAPPWSALVAAARIPRRLAAVGTDASGANGVPLPTASDRRSRRRATEDLFAIGAGKQVVAVDDQSTTRERARTRSSPASRRTSRRSPATGPDLVVLSEDANDIVERARRSSTSRCSSEPPAPNLAGAYAQITQLGRRPGTRGREAP